MNASGRDDWDQHWEDYGEPAQDNPAQEYRRRVIFSLLNLKGAGEGVRLLDIGSGQGDMAAAVRQKLPSAQVLGLELSHSGVEISRRKVPDAQFVQCNLLEESSPPKEQQGWATHAICSEVLEHVDDPGKLLTSARQYMQSGCKLVVTVPGGPMSAFDRHIGHRKHYRIHEVETLFRCAGYEPDRLTRAGFPFFNLYRAFIVLRGEKLIDDVRVCQNHRSSTPARLAMALFRVLFYFNLDSSLWGWQMAATALAGSSVQVTKGSMQTELPVAKQNIEAAALGHSRSCTGVNNHDGRGLMRKYSMSSKTYYILLLLIAAFSLWIRTGFPVYAIPSAMHDEGLFIKLARTLEAGHWLGLYNNLTLAKGMFYPLFIVIAFWTSVPLKIAEHIVYLAASWLTAGMVRRRLGGSYPSLILFGQLAFNPVVWNWSFARVLRQGLYMSLSLAFVALVVAIAFPTSDGANYGVRRLLLRGMGLGLVSAAYWMTREEGIWLFPALTVVIAIALIGVWRPNWLPVSERGTFPRRSAHLKTIALPLVMALAVFTAADWLVAGVNYHHYGVFETNEFRSRSFLRAYGALLRIKHDHWRRFITFPKDARQRAYAVSPAARELESSFEGNIGKGWAWVSCTQLGKPGPCDEVEAPWVMWAFRDAVAAAGHYHSGRDAMRYYDTLADQINSACDRGVIQCHSPGVSVLPPFRWEYLGESVQASKSIARMMFRMVEGPITPLPSTPPDEGLPTFTDTVDGVIPTRNENIVIWGWAAGASAVPTLRLVADTSEKFDSSININPAPDVLAAFPTLKSGRFELKTDCPVAVCNLVLNVAGKDETRVPLAELLRSLGHGPVINGPALKLNIEVVPDFNGHKFTDFRRAAKVKIAGVMASTYADVFPALAIFCGVGLLMATFFRNRFPMPTSLLALGLGSAAAIGTSIALMSYLAATLEFSVANVLYTSPASPFVITFTFVGMYAWLAAFRLGVSTVISSTALHRVLGRVNAKQVS